MNKKGVLGLSLNTVLGLVLAIAIIGLTAYFFGNLYVTFLEKRIDQGTASSFNKLIDEVNDLLEDESKFFTSLNYYIHEDYILVGFDHEKIKDTQYPQGRERPNKCQGKSCLCLLKVEKKKTQEAKDVSCRIIENVNFNVKTPPGHFNYGKENPTSILTDSTYFLVIYGKISTYRFGVKNLEIRKVETKNEKNEKFYYLLVDILE